MGSNSLYPSQAMSPAIVLQPFSFAPNGSSAVAASSIQGEGIASVTRTGTGVFDIVLKSPWTRFAGFCPSVQLASDADVTVSSWNYAAATRTLTVRVRSAGSAADIAANSANRIGGLLLLKNSSVGK